MKPDLVEIPKMIADLIEDNKSAYSKESTKISRDENVLYEILMETNLSDLNLDIVTLSKAISEGYTVKKELVSWEKALQHMENGHPAKYTDSTVVIINGAFFSRKDDGSEDPLYLSYEAIKGLWELL